jgi:hypothetical protein
MYCPRYELWYNYIAITKSTKEDLTVYHLSNKQFYPFRNKSKPLFLSVQLAALITVFRPLQRNLIIMTFDLVNDNIT